MLYTEIQPQHFLVLEKKIFIFFLPYMGMGAILFSGAEPFDQIVKAPCEILWKLVKRFQSCLKISWFYRYI